MPEAQHVWALILAGGEGSRLRALTTQPCGTAVPKQFCSLRGGRSLLEDAIDRAGRLAAPERICTIVAQQHRQWWADSQLASLPAGNLIVQPRNRGTAIGILYSLLHILAKDREARVLLLPADHYVRDEAVLGRSLEQALARVDQGTGKPVLIGVQPDEIDPELGYILPARDDADAPDGPAVACFVEKPNTAVAAEIIRAGGLWNTFIMVGAAEALLELFLPRFAPLVMEMQVIVSRALASGSPAGGWPALVDMYERLPELDFSRHLIEGQESKLALLRVPPCGWSDLGTPRRVGETLRRLSTTAERSPVWSHSTYVNLAAQHAHFERGHVGAGA